MNKFFRNIVARFKAYFSNPLNDINKIEEKLSDLKQQMQEIANMPNKVQAIVKLFQVISPIQDAGGFKQTIFSLQEKNYGQLNSIISALEVLQRHFGNAGRSAYGMNRTKVGEEVTAAKVFLGNVFGIWTFTAEYFLQEEDRMKTETREDISKDPAKPVTNWYCINDYQCAGFVGSHVEGILEQVNILMQAV